MLSCRSNQCCVVTALTRELSLGKDVTDGQARWMRKVVTSGRWLQSYHQAPIAAPRYKPFQETT
jgi:hypothetical protein